MSTPGCQVTMTNFFFNVKYFFLFCLRTILKNLDTFAVSKYQKFLYFTFPYLQRESRMWFLASRGIL